MTKLDKEHGKLVVESEINEISEELNIDEFESNLINHVIPTPNKLGESSGRNTHFMRPMYVPARQTTKFFFGFILKKTSSFKQISLSPISQVSYNLNIDGAHNREEIFEHWKRGMNCVLNLNTTWTALRQTS